MKLKKEIIHDVNLSPEAIALYISLCYFNNDAKECYIDDAFVSGMLSKRADVKLKLVEHIKELNEAGYIQIISSGKKSYIINREKTIMTDSDFYIAIRPEAVTDIINKFGNNKYSILRLYACLIGTLARGNDIPEKYKGKVGFMSQEYLATISGLSTSTVKRCIAELKEIKLIYVLKSNYFQSNNYYSLYKDMGKLIEYKLEREGSKASGSDDFGLDTTADDIVEDKPKRNYIGKNCWCD